GIPTFHPGQGSRHGGQRANVIPLPDQPRQPGMRKVPLYSRSNPSPIDPPIGPGRSLADAPAQNPRKPPRVSRRLRRHGLAIATLTLAAAILASGFVSPSSPSHDDIDSAIAAALENHAPVPPASRAWETVGPSIVRV